MRDHTKLQAFHLADGLALTVYRETTNRPRSETYGLQSQMRRAAVSIAGNIVEGCSRSTQAEYARFVEIAYGSTRKLQYQISLCERLGYRPMSSEISSRSIAQRRRKRLMDYCEHYVRSSPVLVLATAYSLQPAAFS